MAVEKIVKIKVDSSEAVDGVQDLNTELGKTEKQAQQSNQAINDGMSALDKQTGGAISGFKALTGGLKSAVAGFKTLKGAIIATGLGALLLAITSLVSYFTKTERGAQALNVIMGTLGAVVDKLIDVVIHLGEKLFKAFTDPKQALIDIGNAIKTNIENRINGMLELLPALGKAIKLALSGSFSEAGKVAADAVGKVTLGVESVTETIGGAIDAVKEFGSSLADAGAEGARVAKMLNAVEKAERALTVERAKANKQILEARFIADDLTKSTEERMEAIKLAGKLEEEVAAKEMKAQKLRVAALKAQAAIAESDIATLQGIADAEARLADLETASISRKKRLGMEIKALSAESEAQAKAAEAALEEQKKLDDDYQKIIQEGQQLRIKRILEEQAAQQLLVNNFRTLLGQLQTERATDAQKEIAGVNAKYDALLTAAIKAGQADLAFTRSLEQQKQDEITRIQKAAKTKRLQEQAAEVAGQIALASQAVGAIAGLQEALTKDNKKNAEKNFKISKALRLGEAVMNTAAAVLQSLATLPPPASFVAAGIAAVTGAAQIATIAKSRFQAEGGASSTSRPSIPSAATTSPTPMTPNIRFQSVDNQLAGVVNRPMRAYVVNQDINNSNQLERKIRSSATIGG
jgi:hypothetical protein